MGVTKKYTAFFEFRADSAKVQKFGELLDRVKVKAQTAGIAVDGMAIKTRRAGNSFIKSSTQAKTFSNSLNLLKNSFAGAIGMMTAGLPGVGMALGGLGEALTALPGSFKIAAAGAVAGYATIKKGTGAYLDYERGMKLVRQTTLSSADDMKILEKAVKNAAAGSVYGLRDTTLAMNQLAQAGFTTTQMAGSIQPALQLAAAGQLEMAEAAGILTSVMMANEKKVEDLVGINDILAFMHSKSKASVKSLGSGFVNIANSAHSASVSIEQAAAALGALQNIGMGGEEAGTAMKNLFMQLSKFPPNVVKAIEKSGLELEKFFNVRTGRFIDFSGFLKEISMMSDEFRKEITSGFNMRARRGLQALTSQTGIGHYTDYTESLAAGEQEGMAKTKSEILFEDLSGAILQFLSVMETTWEWVGSLFAKTQERFVRVFLPLWSSIVRILGTLFTIINPFINALSLILGLLTPIVQIIDFLFTLFVKWGEKLQESLPWLYWWKYVIDFLSKKLLEFGRWLGILSGGDNETDAEKTGDTIVNEGAKTRNHIDQQLNQTHSIVINGMDTKNARGVANAVREVIESGFTIDLVNAYNSKMAT